MLNLTPEYQFLLGMVLLIQLILNICIAIWMLIHKKPYYSRKDGWDFLISIPVLFPAYLVFAIRCFFKAFRDEFEIKLLVRRRSDDGH
jgi:hypothetical protein